jgi:hypothetical protein
MTSIDLTHVDLADVEKDVFQLAQKAGLVPFRGLFEPDDFRTIAWDTHTDPDPDAFLAVATRLDVKVLIIYRAELEEQMVADAMVSEDPGVDILDLDERRSHNAAVNTLRTHIGQVGSLTLAFVHQDICYTFTLLVPWFEHFLALRQVVADVEEAQLEDEDDEQGVDERN